MPILMLACDPSTAPIDYAAVEDGCMQTGGALEPRACCEGVLDYPATCGEDPCTCAADQAWEIRSCDCGMSACFDGAVCVLGT